MILIKFNLAINYGNRSFVYSYIFGADNSILPASEGNVSQVFNSFGAYTPPTKAPINCLGWIVSGDDKFSFVLSKSIEIHYIRIKLYAIDIKKKFDQNVIKFRASLNEFFGERCRLFTANHFDEQNQLNDNYLTLDFDCGFKENLNKIYDIFLLGINVNKVTFFQTLNLFICDIRLYHFEGGCGEPDIPLQMDVKREDTVVEYQCRDSEHYFIDGVSRLKCDPFGKWQNPFPTCIPKSFCKVLSNNTYGQTVDIAYQSSINGQLGDVYIPNGLYANFSCSSMENRVFLANDSHYVIRGPTHVQCVDGQWVDLTEDNKPECVLKTISIEEATSSSRYVILVLTIVLFISLVIILSLCLYTIRSQRKKRANLRKKAAETNANIYDNPRDIYDDTAIDENYEELKGVYEQVGDDIIHVYEDIEEDIKNEYEVYNEVNNKHSYLEIMNHECDYLEMKRD